MLGISNARRLVVAVAATAVCATGSLLGAASAQAVMVSCGQSLTGVSNSTVVVENDLTNCNNVSGFALSVAGTETNVTLDLDGHTIDGTGGASTNTGILVNGTNVIVKNGTVREFATGIEAFGSGGKVKFLALRSNAVGLRITGTGVTAKGNYLIGWTTAGIQVQAGTAKVLENGLHSGTGPAISLGDVSGATVAGNHITRSASATGIDLAGTDNSVIEDNLTCTNGVHGIALSSDADANLILNNLACDNNGNGIAVDDATSSGNRLEGNEVSLTDGAGIDVSDAQNTKIFGNRSHHNESDGIRVDTPGPQPAKLKDNVVNYNQGYGINVLDVVIILGPNKGKGNALGTCNVPC